MPRLGQHRGARQRRRGQVAHGPRSDYVAEILKHDILLGRAAQVADHPDTLKDSAKACCPASGNRLRSAAPQGLRPLRSVLKVVLVREGESFAVTRSAVAGGHLSPAFAAFWASRRDELSRL
jgi:hypothetical protein